MWQCCGHLGPPTTRATLADIPPKERVVLGPAQDQKKGNQQKNGKYPYHTNPNQPIPSYTRPAPTQLSLAQSSPGNPVRPSPVPLGRASTYFCNTCPPYDFGFVQIAKPKQWRKQQILIFVHHFHLTISVWPSGLSPATKKTKS